MNPSAPNQSGPDLPASPVPGSNIAPTPIPVAPQPQAYQSNPPLQYQPAPTGQAAQPAVSSQQATGVPKPRTNPNSTQNMLQMAEIRDGIVIMNDGSFRSIVMVKSINFDLMSPQEQESVEYSYQGFLNSLYFPIQIFIRSQKSTSSRTSLSSTRYETSMTICYLPC